nr:integrase, catalytic region, zinc finger, CCHC-type, peptidase aspartic, catalytic [Tanacetum cinerariifolium]
IGNVVGARETIGSTTVQKSRIQCYNCKEFGHVVGECQTPKRAKDAAYHREKMLMYKQEEAGIQLNAEQANWRDDTDDDELEDQELEAHYMYMAQLQEVSLDAADYGPIFDDEPLQKVSNDDYYNVFAMENEHPEQSESVHDTYPIDQDAHNVIIDSLDMSYDREEIDQNDDDNDLANEQMEDKLSAHQETISILLQQKEAQIKLYKTREDKELDKVSELENKVKVLDNVVYKTGQSVQTMNMLNNKCRTSLAKPEFLKKAQKANPHMYGIGCYNDNFALILAPESNEVIRLEKESRSKLSDLIRPFDYNKLNNLYDLFIPQREKSSEQRYFLERSRLSHRYVKNGNSKESFNKQTTLLEKRMDESITLDKKCQSSIEIFKVKTYVNMIINGVELCKEKIANRTYSGYIDQFIQNTIEAKFSPVISRINAGLEQFHRPQLKSKPMGDIVMRNNSQGKKQEVEDQRRNVKLPKNKISVTACNDSLNAKTLNVNFVSAMCDKCVLNDKHDMCILNSVAKPIKKAVASESNQKPKNITRKLYERVRLNHNLFFVGQFCDADLEVAFRKSTCYIRDLKGNDLLTGSCGTDLYLITLQDTNCPNLICLTAKSSSSQAWLWHRRLSYLNFDTINLLSKNDIVKGFFTKRLLLDARSSPSVNFKILDRSSLVSSRIASLFQQHERNKNSSKQPNDSNQKPAGIRKPSKTTAGTPKAAGSWNSSIWSSQHHK